MVCVTKTIVFLHKLLVHNFNDTTLHIPALYGSFTALLSLGENGTLRFGLPDVHIAGQGTGYNQYRLLWVNGTARFYINDVKFKETKAPGEPSVFNMTGSGMNVTYVEAYYNATSVLGEASSREWYEVYSPVLITSGLLALVVAVGGGVIAAKKKPPEPPTPIQRPETQVSISDGWSSDEDPTRIVSRGRY